jgi:hypothetical protein
MRIEQKRCDGDGVTYIRYSAHQALPKIRHDVLVVQTG